jgi:ATP-dependent protease ClpP protease subunit
MPIPRSPFGRTPASPKGLTVRADAGAETAELLLYDEIGIWGITARDVVQALEGVQAGTLTLRLNSPGGDVMDGVAIYNALRSHPARVVTQVDGLAASIASVIALAGEEVRIAENGFFMIHDPWALTIGTAADHRQTAGVLDKMAGMILDTYMQRAEADRAQVEAWMAAETWFTGAEAVEAGFADTIDAPGAPKARYDLSVFRNAPAALRDAAPVRPSERDLERLLRDAGLSRSEAKAAVAAVKKPDSRRDAAEEDVTAAAAGLLRHLRSLSQ